MRLALSADRWRSNARRHPSRAVDDAQARHAATSAYFGTIADVQDHPQTFLDRRLVVPSSSVRIIAVFSGPLKTSTQESELILTVSNRYQQLRRALLIAVMAFTLAGVQLIQSSPLHDHTQHTVDCALCHLQLGDAVPLQPTLGVAFLAHSVPYARYLHEFYSSSNPSPYHGRAPPFSSR